MNRAAVVQPVDPRDAAGASGQPAEDRSAVDAGQHAGDGAVGAQQRPEPDSELGGGHHDQDAGECRMAGVEADRGRVHRAGTDGCGRGGGKAGQAALDVGLGVDGLHGGSVSLGRPFDVSGDTRSAAFPSAERGRALLAQRSDAFAVLGRGHRLAEQTLRLGDRVGG